MQEESQAVAAEETNAQQQEVPVSNEAQEAHSESVEQESSGSEESSTQAEGELPKAVAERLAKEKHRREKAERRLAELNATMANLNTNPNYQGYAQMPQQQQQQYQAEPNIDPVQKTVIETLYKLNDAEQQRRQQQSAYEREVTFQMALQKASDRYEDFDDIVRDPNFPINPILETVKRFSNAPDILYKLGKNRDELTRISHMHPDAQLDALIDLSASMKTTKNVTSKAPAPLSDVKGTASTQSTSAKNPAGRSIDEIRAEIRKQSWGRGRSK